MRPIALVPLLIAFAAAAGCQRETADVADTTPVPSSTPSAPAAPATTAAPPLVTEFEGRGAVASLDRSSGTVTLDSDAIADLGWSARTVTLPVETEALPQDLDSGDSVRFTLKQDRGGRLTVSGIEADSTVATAENESE